MTYPGRELCLCGHGHQPRYTNDGLDILGYEKCYNDCGCEDFRPLYEDWWDDPTERAWYDYYIEQGIEPPEHMKMPTLSWRGQLDPADIRPGDKHGPKGDMICIRRSKFIHNCVAHPLLFIWPRLGWWLHDRTDP